MRNKTESEVMEVQRGRGCVDQIFTIRQLYKCERVGGEQVDGDSMHRFGEGI